MKLITKVLVSIGIFIGFFFLFGIVVFMQKSNGNSTPGIFGLILAFGLFAGLKAVWKKPKEVEEKDSHQLDKKS